jgi:hypothetical protein
MVGEAGAAEFYNNFFVTLHFGTPVFRPEPFPKNFSVLGLRKMVIIKAVVEAKEL